MLIHQKNIKDFIVFLYRLKNGALPTDKLINSWKDLSEETIMFHLRKMTSQWGWTEVQLQHSIQQFINDKKPITPPADNTLAEPEPLITEKDSAQQYDDYPFEEKKSHRGRYIWITLLLIVLSLLGYAGYEYNQYYHLERLYSTTDNVAIRDIKGNTVGRMDIFTRNGSKNSLRVVNNETYNIVVDKEGNMSESRKLLTDSADFWDYLLGNESDEVYVNKNYLTKSKDYGSLQKSVFAELSRYPKEMADIKSDMRKVIIGSLALMNNGQSLYIKNACNNNSNAYSSVIRILLNDKKTISVICKMSDNKFYKFKGIPDENIFYPPTIVPIQDPVTGTMEEEEYADLLFKNTNNEYYLYSCDKLLSYFHAIKDDKGDIDYFLKTYGPTAF